MKSISKRFWLMMALFGGVATAQAADFTVANVGITQWRFNSSSNNPVLTFARGSSNTFMVTVSGHPFSIKTNAGSGSGSRYNIGVTGQAAQNSTLIFVVPANAPNTLFYDCEVHASMSGTINVVNGPNTAPAVNITSPANNAVFASPANVTIQATASDSDGSVTNVQFRIGTTILTNDIASPYSVATNNLPASSYTLSAIAFDNLGSTATNSINIIVDALPAISITNPVSGKNFRAPTNVIIRVSTSDADGTVTNVQFFSGPVSLGNVTNNLASGLASFTNLNLSAGNYTFTAVARDNFGGAATSTAVNVFLLTNAVTAAPSRSTNGQAVFTLKGIAGQTYTIEASTNLMAWAPILTNTAPANVYTITDFTSTNVLLRFYRSRQDF